MPTQVFYNAQSEEAGRHMGKIGADWDAWLPGRRSFAAVMLLAAM